METVPADKKLPTDSANGMETHKDIANKDVAMDQFLQLLETPQVVGAWLGSTVGESHLTVQVSFRSTVASLKQDYAYLRMYVIDRKLDGIARAIEQPPCPNSFEFHRLSSSGRRLACLNEVAKKKETFSVMDGERVHFVVDLSTAEQFSKIYTPTEDAGGVEWSPDEKFIGMVVRPGKVQSEELSPGLPKFCELINSDLFAESKGAGETYMHLAEMKIAILDVDGKVFSLPDFPADAVPSQLAWAPDSRSFYFTALQHSENRRFGIKFCRNRVSHLYKVQVGGGEGDDGRAQWKVEKVYPLGSEKIAVHCPRVSPDGKHVIFLENPVLLAHNGCSSIKMYSIANGTISMLSDRVQEPPIDIFDDDQVTPGDCGRQVSKAYAGIYSCLPKNCWASDSRHVLFSSESRFYSHIFSLDLEHKSIRLVKPPQRNRDSKGCWTILTVRDDFLVVEYSSVAVPFELYVGHIEDYDDNVPTIKWQLIAPDVAISPITGNFKRLTVKANQSNDEEAMLIFNCDDDTLIPTRPTVIAIHGGPHSSYSDNFIYNHTRSTLLLAGYNVLLVNYAGSTGYGQKTIDRLLGNIGEVDVKSCEDLIKASCERFKLDQQRLFYIGGSHSGFLGILLMARNQKMFVASVLGNPLCEAVSMLMASDIPDFVFAEAMNEHVPDQFTFSEDMVSRLMKHNPMRFAHEIRTPTLLLLGTEDRRVPCSAAYRLKQIISEAGTDCKLRQYPDTHSLMKIPSQIDSFVHVYDWLAKYMP